MAFRSVTVPWLSGGLLVLGYAAFSWLRAKRRGTRSAPLALPPHDTMSRAPVEGMICTSDESQAHASSRRAALGALFLGRASKALSPFQFGPDWPSERFDCDRKVLAGPAVSDLAPLEMASKKLGQAR